MYAKKMNYFSRITYWDKLSLKTDDELKEEYALLFHGINFLQYKDTQRREAFLIFLAKNNKMHILE